MSDVKSLVALVDLAMSQGARGAEVVGFESKGFNLVWGKAPKPTKSSRVTVRVWVDSGRCGFKSGSLKKGEELVGQALASTFESPEDVFAGPVEKVGSVPSGLGVLDRRHQHLELSDREEALDDALRQASADPRFVPSGFRYSDQRTWRALANSRGAAFEEEGSEFRLGGKLTGADFEIEDQQASRAFASIASLPLGTRLVQRARELTSEGVQLESGPVRVVFPPRPMARLIALLGQHFTPSQLADGSFMLQDRGDEPSVSTSLHIVDDGQLPGGLHTRAFDDRGSFPVPVMLLREGVVAGRFLSPEHARRLDTRATGHVFGNTLRPNNLIMRAGTRSINALLTERKGPSLMVDDLPVLTGLNIKTGAFKVQVNGVVMDANKRVGAMRGVWLRGNLVTLLSNIVEICNNTDRIQHVDAASIIADGLELEI